MRSAARHRRAASDLRTELAVARHQLAVAKAETHAVAADLAVARRNVAVLQGAAIYAYGALLPDLDPAGALASAIRATGGALPDPVPVVPVRAPATPEPKEGR